MSIRRSGLASRSFIIGRRLWPPAMTRASGPCRWSAAIAPSMLLARSYSNGPGVCNGVVSDSGTAGRKPLAGRADVLAPLVALGGAGADHRRARELLRARVPDVRVERSRREAPALDVAEHGFSRARHGDGRLAPEPRERERALGVDLTDARRVDRRAVGEVAQAGGGGPRVEALDEPDGVGQAGLLDEQPLEQVDARVQLLVDRGQDVVDRRALLHDPADVDDHLVQARDDLPELEDRRDEEVDEREHDQDDADEQDDGRGAHARSASSRMTSSEPPYAASPATVCSTWSCVVSSRGAASRSLDPAAAVAAMPSTVGTIAFAACRTPLSRYTTSGSTTTSSTMSPIHQSVIAASGRRRSPPCGRSRVALRG